MTQQEYNDGLISEINANKIDLMEHIDAIDMSEMINQKGKYFDIRDASIILEEFLAEKE